MKLIPPFIYLLLIVSWFELSAQNIWESPLQKCWEGSDSNITKAGIASDNVNNIYFSTSDNNLNTLNLLGQKLWKTNLGEKIINFLAETDKVYLLSQSLTNTQEYYIYTISNSTGLVIQKENVSWQILEKFNLPNIQRQERPLMTPENILINKLLFFDLLVFDNNNPLYYDTTQNILYTSLPSKNIQIFLNQNDNIPVIIKTPFQTEIIRSAESQKFLIGNAIGEIALLNYHKVIWKKRIGGEIIEMFWNDFGVTVISNDNFIYQFSRANGKILWKRRFSGRLTTSYIKEKQLIATTINNEGNLFLIDITSGKVINQISIENNNFFIGKPIIIKDLLILLTNQGITAYSPKTCQ